MLGYEPCPDIQPAASYKKNKNLYIIRYTIIPLNVIAVRFFIRIAGVEPA